MGYQLSKVKKKHGRAVFAVAALKTDQSSSSGQLACLDIFSHLKLWYIVAIWFALGRLVLCQSWLRYWDAKKLTKTRSPLLRYRQKLFLLRETIINLIKTLILSWREIPKNWQLYFHLCLRRLWMYKLMLKLG